MTKNSAFGDKNKLNSLQPREFCAFLNTVEDGAWSSKEDVEFSIETNSIPTDSIAEIVKFFTKTGDSMLHIFCGSGRVAANICVHSGVSCTGITLNRGDVGRYRERVQQDMFGEEFPIIVGDALEVLENKIEQKFDFILLDPPRFGGTKKTNSKDLSVKTRYEFIDYVACVLDSASVFLKESGYLVALIDDQYADGEYISPGIEVSTRCRAVSLRGIKIFRFHRTSENRGNFGRYIPSINHNPVFIFQAS